MIYRFLVSGKVQGVYYRKYTSAKLQKLGVKGYIHNLNDGRVEAVINPQNTNLSQILSILQEGSPLSRVENIEYEEINENIEFDGFKIKY